jgi:hypothetical protein
LNQPSKNQPKPKKTYGGNDEAKPEKAKQQLVLFPSIPLFHFFFQALPDLSKIFGERRFFQMPISPQNFYRQTVHSNVR